MGGSDADNMGPTVLFVAQDIFAISSVIAKLATDFRHLARSEISEVHEGFSDKQVGSSTMPQKRNPWNLEHVCSLYKILYSKLTLFELDLVKEGLNCLFHQNQRD